MRTIWVMALGTAFAGLAVAATGLWMLRLERRHRALAEQLERAQGAMEQVDRRQGGIPELRDRLRERKAWLESRRSAYQSDAAAFSRRVEDVFTELGVDVTASSGWVAWSEFEGKEEGKAAFERTFEGAGSFHSLLSAVRTIESWPDTPRLRTLEVTPASAEQRLNFNLTLVVVRTGGGAVETGG